VDISGNGVIARVPTELIEGAVKRSVNADPMPHAAHLARAGWSRRQTTEWLYAHAWRTLADLKRGGKVEPAFYASPALVDWLYRDAPQGRPAALPGAGDVAGVQDGDETVRVHRGLGPEDIMLTVGGGDAGGHSAFFPSWSRGRSVPFVTKEIPE